MDSSPLVFLSVGITSSIIIFGVAVRNFEYPLLDQAPSAVNFEYYWNSFWCMVLTMTTVGYGDIYPVTHLGRLTTILACIWGMFIMSMIIVTLTNIITLTKEEDDAYNSLEESKELIKILHNDAALFIQKYYQYYTARKQQMDFRKRLKSRTDYMIVQHRFHFKRMMIKYANPDITDAIDELSETVFGFLSNGTKRIKLLKEDVTKQISEMRQNQYEIDVKMAKLYDNSLKINSFLCLCNRQSKFDVQNLDKLKMHFNPKGEKNTHIKTKTFVKEFFDARKTLSDFFEKIEIANEASSPVRSPVRIKSP